MYRLANRLPMGLRRTIVLAATHLSVIAAIPALASDSSSDSRQAKAVLMQDFPGLRFFETPGGLRGYFAAPMSAADDPAVAAQTWLDLYAGALDLDQNQITLARASRVGIDGRLTLFAYEQVIDGLLVDGSSLKIVVLNGSPSRVIYVAARTSPRQTSPIISADLTADDALSVVKSDSRYAHLREWTDPQEVLIWGVAQGEEMHAVRTWKFRGSLTDPARVDAWTFYVDAMMGELVRVRSEVHYADLTGTVSGWASPGLLPDVDYSLPQVTPMPDVLITAGTEADYADGLGNFVFSDLNPGLTTVGADMIGHWVVVSNNSGPTLALDDVVSVPGNIDFQFAESMAEFDVSQVNAHIHTTLTHDFYKTRQPDFTGIDQIVTANVNQQSSCNAFFTGTTINFFNAANGCPNTAYSTVIAHEYGHFVVDRHFLSQGSFGEGYADTLALMIYDSPITGADFFGPGTWVRNTELANKQYPCFDAIHSCGQVLSGVWYDLKLNFEAAYGEDAGLELARQLFTDWSEITDGGDGNDAAHPQTAVEVLIADDDDGYVGNGTPHRLDICDAFAKHNIDCPELDALAFSYPDGLPDLLNIDEPTTIHVNVIGVDDTPVAGSGKLYFRTDDGLFTTVSMNESAPNSYEAVLPAVSCPTRIQFYFSADAVNSGTHFDPVDAPDVFFAGVAASGSVSVLDLDFETDPGWTVSGDATDGQWDRALPLGNGDRGDPATDFDGSGQCFLTDHVDENSDVDGGTTTLTSNTYDLSLLTDPYVTYARWYSNNFGADPENDVFVIEVSGDGGIKWVILETVGPNGIEVRGDWYVKTFRIADFVSITDAFAIRFVASDLNAGSVIEAGIDAFEIFDYQCPAVPCAGDLNGDGTVDPLDSGYALARLGCLVGTGDPECDAADANLDGVVDPLDVGHVLSRLGTCE